EERGAQLVLIRDELVVGVDLFLDGFGAGDALGAQHLLRLPLHGLEVFEHDRDVVAQSDAADLLELDDLAAQDWPDLLVLVERLEIGGGELSHKAKEPARKGAGSPFRTP